MNSINGQSFDKIRNVWDTNSLFIEFWWSVEDELLWFNYLNCIRKQFAEQIKLFELWWFFEESKFEYNHVASLQWITFCNYSTNAVDLIAQPQLPISKNLLCFICAPSMNRVQASMKPYNVYLAKLLNRILFDIRSILCDSHRHFLMNHRKCGSWWVVKWWNIINQRRLKKVI